MTNDLPEVRLWIAVLSSSKTRPAPSEDHVEGRRWLSVPNRDFDLVCEPVSQFV